MFDNKTKEAIGHYVYALIDPRQKSGRVFYVGKGQGNRLFQHELQDDSKTPEGKATHHRKLQTINAIQRAGLSVGHKLVRYGLTEDEAFVAEAAVIDVLKATQPGVLTNAIDGQTHGHGYCDADDLAHDLSAEPLEADGPLLIIKIEKLWPQLVNKYGSATSVPWDEIYRAARGAWVLSEKRVRRTECVLVVATGLVRAVVVPTGWCSAKLNRRRKMMTGTEPRDQFRQFEEQYVGKSVAHLFKRGSANSVHYVNC